MCAASWKTRSGAPQAPINLPDRQARYRAAQPTKEILMPTKMTPARKIIAAMAMGAALVTLTACNTVKGLGRDIESVGEAGDRAI